MNKHKVILKGPVSKMFKETRKTACFEFRASLGKMVAQDGSQLGTECSCVPSDNTSNF